MSDNKQKHLEFIQGVITRLASNSFSIKGWSVVLVSAFFALAAPNSNISFVFLAYIPAAMFWGLDGYFLYQERLYRKLYDSVRMKNETEIDYSMNVELFKVSKVNWISSVISLTLFSFHGALMLSILLVIYFM